MQRPPAASSIASRIASGERSPRKLSSRGRTKLGDLRAPRLAVARRYRGEQRAQDLARVAHQPDRRSATFFPISDRIQLDVNHLRAPGKAGEVAGDPVVEPETDAEDQVGLLDRAVDMHLAVHARHAEMQRVRLGEAADAEQGGDHRDPGALGQRAQLLVRAGQNDPVSRHDERALGLPDEAGGLREAGRRGHGRPPARVRACAPRCRRPRRPVYRPCSAHPWGCPPAPAPGGPPPRSPAPRARRRPGPRCPRPARCAW